MPAAFPGQIRLESAPKMRKLLKSCKIAVKKPAIKMSVRTVSAVSGHTSFPRMTDRCTTPNKKWHIVQTPLNDVPRGARKRPLRRVCQSRQACNGKHGFDDIVFTLHRVGFGSSENDAIVAGEYQVGVITNFK
jgi:hypothetical protein